MKQKDNIILDTYRKDIEGEMKKFKKINGKKPTKAQIEYINNLMKGIKGTKTLEKKLTDVEINILFKIFWYSEFMVSIRSYIIKLEHRVEKLEENLKKEEGKLC